MSTLKLIDQDSLLKWLEKLGIDHYLCGQCSGVHISETQSQIGVLESRVFLEQGCLIFTSEIDIRNSTLLAVNADLARLNGSYANLKFFLDLTDEGSSRLIICDTQWVSAGISREQVDVFLSSAIEAKLDAINELVDCHFIESSESSSDNVRTNPSLH